MREVETVWVNEIGEYVPELTGKLGFQRLSMFRGQADADWALVPPLLRESLEDSEFSTWTEWEASLAIQFKERASGELSRLPQTEMEWMAVAQHHGLPTRFSAWSENGLVALYFATEETPDQKDGVVYRILPGDRSLVVTQDYEQVPDEPRIYIPLSRESSLQNQRACFLSHALPKENAAPESFEDTYQLGDARMHLAKIMIPHSEKRALRLHLSNMGVDSRSLFPGLGGVCRQLKDDMYTHSSSFEWVF